MNFQEKRNSLILTALVILFSLGCSSSHKDYGEAVFSVASLIFAEKVSQYDAIIVIPGSGCTGCISQAELYFTKNIENERLQSKNYERL